jgi:20S proteasome alpha/beta subunit
LTLIIGATCQDGIVLAADRRRMAWYEKGPDTNKLFKLASGVLLAGAGDDAVLNEARIYIELRINELQSEISELKLFDIVKVTMNVVNELVNCYRDKVEEAFGYVLAGLENMSSGAARVYTIFGAGFSDVPWTSIGSGSSYARPLVELLLTQGNLSTEEAAKIMPTIFTLVSNVQTTVGGGVDIGIIKDKQGFGDIVHEGEVNLSRLRSAILTTMGL